MNRNDRLTRYLSPVGVWALSFGCSVGWGAFVMPGSTFLPIAGPVGTALGIAIGAIIMLIIGRNYYFLMTRYPDAGGTYTYTKKTLGFDHGFLSAWFLLLTYIVIIWANLTALALIGRYLLGDTFCFGFHYQIAGYDIYFGEILAAIGVLVLCGLICVIRKRLAVWVQILMAIILIGGIVAVFAFAMFNSGGGSVGQPAFSELNGSSKFMQVVHIIALTPWAYVGFESVSHSAREFRFKKNKTFRIIIISVFTAGLAYILLSILAVSAAPEGYDGWTSYIGSLGNISGLEGLPTFFAADSAMGRTGVIILGVAVVGGIITGIIGNMIASTRVLFAIAKDDILPQWFAKTNKDGNPINAIMFVTAISAVIPFFGRTAISWIVDVTTVGGTIIYCYTSAAALKKARSLPHRRLEVVTGAAGVLVSFGFALYFLIPNLSSVSTLSTESYLILTVWSILGLLFFRRVFGKDTRNRFGKSIVVWIVLLLLIMFTSVIWMQQENTKAITTVKDNISERYNEHIVEYHSEDSLIDEAGVEEFVAEKMDKLDSILLRNNLLRIGMIVIAVAIIFMVYSLMSKRQREFERVKVMAYKDQLTGIGNKHAYKRLEAELNQEISLDQISAFAVAVCDLNGLKAVNDTLGHAKGDEYIRQASRLLCDVFSHSPVFRTGGDEFVALLRERDFENRELLVRMIHENNDKNKSTGEVVIAVGLSDYIQGFDKSLDSVFARADAAMYKDKQRIKSEG